MVIFLDSLVVEVYVFFSIIFLPTSSFIHVRHIVATAVNRLTARLERTRPATHYDKSKPW